MEVRCFTPRLNEKYRILVHYKNKWRPILWFQVKKDGSIYLGPRYENIESLKKGSGIAKNGKIRINYADGENITDPNVIKQAGKTSFHASGVISSLGNRQFRNKLRDVKQQELLCMVLFEHPSKFKAVDRPRKTDICIKYSLDETSPLQAQLYVAPKDSSLIIDNKNLAYQIAMLLSYEGFEESMKSAITLQIKLGHGPKGLWPQQTYLLFPSNIQQ